MRHILLFALFIFVSGCTPSDKTSTTNSTPTTPPDTVIQADTIYHGGPIYTAIDAAPQVQAVAVRGNMILETGAYKDILSTFKGESTAIVDLEGAAMYPGLTDAHAHLIGIGMRELTLNLEGTTSIAALAEVIENEIKTLPAGETLYGGGWIETGWPENRFPTRADIDPVSPDNPVILERADGHSMLVNSAALTRAGITADTPDPDGGRIEKDSDGTPTGILIDAAQELVADLIEAPSEERRLQAYEIGAGVYAAYGWTGLHNMSVNPDDILLMESLAKAPAGATSKLPIRVYNSLDAYGLEGLEKTGAQRDQSGRIITRAIKVYADGALGSRGAALFEPYTDQQDTHGLVLIDDVDAINIYKRAFDAGLQVNTHAIGDRGNALVLFWYEAARNSWLKENREENQDTTSPRFRIEHAQIVRPEDIPLFREHGIIPSMQPSHAIGDLHFAPDRLGDNRLQGAYAWRSMIDAGLMLAAGSDAPVERGDPRIEFYAAVARRDTKGFQGNNWHPEEAVTRQEALKMLTIWPAYASFQEDSLGTIEKGKRADFTVFSDDIMTIDERDILTVDTVMTIVDGQVIYRNK